jgi:hypothetical protein
MPSPDADNADGDIQLSPVAHTRTDAVQDRAGGQTPAEAAAASAVAAGEHEDILSIHQRESSVPGLDVADDRPLRPLKIDIHTGRPPIGQLFDQIAQLHARLEGGPTSPHPSHALGSRSPTSHHTTAYRAPAQSQHIAVYACGPRELVDDVQQQSMTRGWHLHKESFTL